MPPLRKLLLPALLLAALLLSPPSPVRAWDGPQYLVGAYYYVWYPDNFRHGYLREKLRPAQAPLLGEYDSRDPEVARQHIAWASRYGIDFFAVDWWPSREQQNAVISQGLLQAPNLGDIKFCIFHETWELAFRPTDGKSPFTKSVTDKFIADIKKVARTFFDNPSYLKIQGRPVIILYLTRSFTGDYGGAITRLRRELQEMGYPNPYLIADEVYWQVLSTSTQRLVDEPQVNRMHFFDAVTAYNMHDQLLEDEHYGYPGGNSFLQDVADKYQEYYQACGRDIAFVPGVMPGFNDRGTRLGYDHFAIPRLMEAGAQEGSVLAAALQDTAIPFLNQDQEVNMVLITSWNEWNEDTNIEPVSPAPKTNDDETGRARRFSQGFYYAGYDTTYLEVVRDRLHAVYGRLLDGQGLPVPGRDVCAWDLDNATRECDTSDSQGYYVISRLNLSPGHTYQVGPADTSQRTRFTVLDTQAVKADFTWPDQD